jgi:transcriptional regulator with XRE-family HTH domain
MHSTYFSFREYYILILRILCYNISGGGGMSFGSRLRELRTEKKVSQKQVASDIGISITTISQYESDSRFPNEEMLKQLCKYYQISSDYLLGLTDTKHAPLSKKEAKEKMMMSNQMDLICDLIDMIQPESKKEDANEN